MDKDETVKEVQEKIEKVEDEGMRKSIQEDLERKQENTVTK